MSSGCNHYYRVFNRPLCSNLALPVLGDSGAPLDAGLRFMINPNRTPVDLDVIHEFRANEGDLTLRAYRQRSGKPAYGLFFPRGGYFHIAPDFNHIECAPLDEASRETIEHLLLDQVIPRVLAQAGALVLHASCVRLPSGRLVAFVGASGAGKSTLASALLEVGAILLGDDSLLVECRDDRVFVTPAYTGLRLWPDSADHFFNKRQVRDMAHYSNKQRVQLVQEVGSESAMALDALYILDGPAAGAPRVLDPGSPSAIIMALVQASFGLDIRDPDIQRRCLAQLQAMQQTGVRLRRLSVPHDYRRLPEVCSALASDLA